MPILGPLTERRSRQSLLWLRRGSSRNIHSVRRDHSNVLSPFGSVRGDLASSMRPTGIPATVPERDPVMSARERRAYRIAGRAVGATLVGAPINKVSVNDGTRILWNKLRPSAALHDDRMLARILITLMGVGAQERYSFGVPPGEALGLMPRADEPELMRDVEEVDAISIELSDASRGRLEAVWLYAAEIICHDDVWEAVETVAQELLGGQLDARQIARLCCSGAEAQDDE
jgi:hypothetical protein